MAVLGTTDSVVGDLQNQLIITPYANVDFSPTTVGECMFQAVGHEFVDDNADRKG
jgi:hypothetical protein